MNKETKYVLGLAFDNTVSRVLLIRKKRGPSFNIGKWNGIGGKIEPGESPRLAMSREFNEECGISTDSVDWQCFHTERHIARREQTQGIHLSCMTTVLTYDQFWSYRTTTDEQVCHVSVNSIRYETCVYNMQYLLKMSLVWHAYPDHRWIEG